MTANGRIVGLGHALVDVLVETAPAVVDRHGLALGGMHLVDALAAAELYDDIGPGVMQSGGSVANTIAHLGADGHDAVFLGHVAADGLGDAFVEDMGRVGVATPGARRESPATGRCVIMVTPGGERTMSTFLGAASTLDASIANAMPGDAAMLLVEGYVFDAPKGPDAIAAAVERARAIGAKIALTPSDSGCVARHLGAMRAFIADPCDALIGNEAEMMALSGTGDAEAALDWAQGHAEVAAVTLSDKGCLVKDRGAVVVVPAEPVETVVDTTGAGDAYAAGFLGALARGGDIEAAARAGGALAARVITHFGARERA
ncbi:MAG: adenosine kinase [Pseudomonadota bacterium]